MRLTPLAALRARRPDPLRVLLVQLPIQELVFRRIKGNELVAPGYLKASAEKALGAAVEVEILPRALVDRLGDAALAQAIAARAPAVVTYTAPRPAIGLSGVPSPYLSGAIEVELDRAISVEALRGCPFKCSFCYYYKQFAKVNAFPRGWMRAHFEFARERGVKELF